MCKWNNTKTVKLAYPREYSKTTEVPVDSCISKLVQLLNNFKVHTLGCCCGHGKGRGSILIDKDSYSITKFGYCEIFLNPDMSIITNKKYLEAVEESKNGE